MYRNEYEKVLEQLKTVLEYQQDYANWKSCIQNVHQYNRINAWNFLQEMIHWYANEISLFGALVDHVVLIPNLDMGCYSDQEIKGQLQYIAAHIPIYVLIRKGEHTLAQKLGKWCQACNDNQK